VNTNNQQLKRPLYRAALACAFAIAFLAIAVLSWADGTGSAGSAGSTGMTSDSFAGTALRDRVADPNKGEAKTRPHSGQTAQGASCDMKSLVHFAFTDSHHTEFLIPSAYLYDPNGLYNNVNNPTAISLSVWQRDFAPDCGRGSGRLGQVITLTIEHNLFHNLLQNRRTFQKVMVASPNDQFLVYRNEADAKATDRRDVQDLYLPTDPRYADNVFAECNHWLNVPDSDGFVGCSIYARVTDTVFVNYAIAYSDISSYRAISDRLRTLILGFITHP
jgi:hypothetical protein